MDKIWRIEHCGIDEKTKKAFVKNVHSFPYGIIVNNVHKEENENSLLVYDISGGEKIDICKMQKEEKTDFFNVICQPITYILGKKQQNRHNVTKT